MWEGCATVVFCHIYEKKNLCCEKTEKLGSEGQLVENVADMLCWCCCTYGATAAMQRVARLMLASLGCVTATSTDPSQDRIVRRRDFGCAAIF